ncbi:MAG: 6-phosphogluconolactonase [Pseudomonadota bacterium]
MSRRIAVYSTTEDLGAAVARRTALLAARAMAERGRFMVALSGGSVINIVSPLLVAEPLRTQVDWSGWHVFWADERCVPSSSPESNYGVAQRLFLSRVDIPRRQIYALDDALGAGAAAAAYESTLKRVFRTPDGRLPVFDLVLLGIGADGHTASLFPGSPVLRETVRWAAPVLDAPQPPSERVTLTPPTLNNSREVIFAAAGLGKRSILSKVFGPNNDRPALPAELVRSRDGVSHWLVDEAAGGDLK